MGLHRYSAIDAYTLEELKRQYQFSGPKGRIRFLRRLYRDIEQLPYEIALMAVTDDAVEMRQWIARYGRLLDYRDRRYIDGQLVSQFPERNLTRSYRNLHFL